MLKKEFKDELFYLLKNEIDDMGYTAKIEYVYNLLVDFEKENEELRDLSNKGKVGQMRS